MQISQTNFINSTRPAQSKNQRFGFSGAFVGRMDTVFSWVQKTRTREMLLEDLIGMAFLRTAIDLVRPYIYKKSDINQKPRLNPAAARERFFRESMSIVTDNVSGGLVAASLAWGANKIRKTPNMGNYFASNETLELFSNANAQNRQAFIQYLATRLTPSAQHEKTVFNIVKNAVSTGKKEVCEDAAVSIAKLANQKTLTLNGFQMDSLLKDAADFVKFMENQTNQVNWGCKAKAVILETLAVNKIKLFAGLGVALVSTLMVPYLNSALTRKVNKIEDYPAEAGLKKLKKVRPYKKESFFERNMPYLTECLKHHKWLPFLMTSFPMLAFFTVDTVKLSNGLWRSAFLNPFAGKSYWKKMTSILQFGKGFPFTTQQQMASCYAFLIFSRMVSARSENEFRERFVDSFALGWMLWILGTPFIKRTVARLWDKTNLLKEVSPNVYATRRRIELERLVLNISDPKAVKSLIWKKGTESVLGKSIAIGGFSTLATMFLLGVVEPLIAIKWTEFRSLSNKKIPTVMKSMPSTVWYPNQQPVSAPWVPAQKDMMLPYFNLRPETVN